jgi:hypothetical protein
MRLLTVLATGVWAAGGVLAVESAWVRPGPDGKLVYKTTPAGDRIMDFSHAGFMGGGVALPEVPVQRTVSPTGTGDDTAAIQKAIDEVAALPLEANFRGAVRLGAGVFLCSSPLSISASGVVLRGNGSGGETTRTTLRLTGKPHTAITIRSGSGGRRAQPGDDAEPVQAKFADAYVPSGATTIKVLDAAGFKVGDTIEVRRPVTGEWIKFMRMDDLVRDGKPQTWLRAGYRVMRERTHGVRGIINPQQCNDYLRGHALGLAVSVFQQLFRANPVTCRFSQACQFLVIEWGAGRRRRLDAGAAADLARDFSQSNGCNQAIVIGEFGDWELQVSELDEIPEA